MTAEGPTTPGRWRINNTFFQPFLSYALPTHTTVSLSSEMQYNWTTGQWTVPVAAGVSQLLRVGGQLIQVGGALRYWAETPVGGPTWGLRFTATFVFPTRRQGS